MVKIAITMPTMNISGVKPMNDVKNMIIVAVKLPKVPAYPGSAHNLFPMNTNNAAIIGILSALFVKYLFDFVFPKPLDENTGEDSNE